MSVTDTTPIIEKREKQYKFNCCDGFGCLNESYKKISVSAGSFGNIILSLCPACAKLFEN